MGNVAINGFGRIGRSILRIIVENNSDINVVAINDLGNYENLAYLLKHDSVMGILDSDVRVDGDNLLVGDRLFVTKYSYGYSKHSFPFSPPFFTGRIFSSKPSRGDVIVF